MTRCVVAKFQIEEPVDVQLIPELGAPRGGLIIIQLE